MEAEINELEVAHPTLIQARTDPRSSRKTILLKFYISALVLAAIGLFLPMPWKILGPLLVLGVVAYTFTRRKGKIPPAQGLPEIKGKWQEKLGQLDIVLATIRRTLPKHSMKINVNNKI